MSLRLGFCAFAISIPSLNLSAGRLFWANIVIRVFVTSVVGLVYRVIVTYGKEDPVWNGGNVAITAYVLSTPPNPQFPPFFF